MKLKMLLQNILPAHYPGELAEKDIPEISCDSRAVSPGSLFVARSGPNLNGADFISEAVQKGAAVILHSGPFAISEQPGVTYLKVADTQAIWPALVDRFYDSPSRKIKVFGVTGTNGKTTITYLLESILAAAGKNCAVIGTINYRLAGKIIPAKNTTPGLQETQQHLQELAKQNISYCAMEVSSHALEQGRVDLIDFTCAIFTNLTGDHLDYHKDMENYFLAKALLFKRLSRSATAVINIDDPYGERLTKISKGKILTYGLSAKAQIQAIAIKISPAGSAFVVQTPRGQIKIQTTFIGQHNIYNILAVVAACISDGIALEAIKKGIEDLKAVPGRLERIEAEDFHVFVDYAHTEDALKNVLSSLRQVGGAKIITVFGCGGDRDRTKRPKMGRVVGELADLSIVTSDNPRSENPQAIVDEILPGFQSENYKVILDREEAIREALSLARAGDIVLIAGKGHEDYQIFKDRTIHFDDREVVRGILKCSPSKTS